MKDLISTIRLCSEVNNNRIYIHSRSYELGYIDYRPADGGYTVAIHEEYIGAIYRPIINKIKLLIPDYIAKYKS